MNMRTSILAGEILSLLENVSGSVRIIDIESMLQTTKKDINLAIERLQSGGLITLINEENRNAIRLNKSAKEYKGGHLDNRMAGSSV